MSTTQPDYTSPRGRLVDRLQDAGQGMGYGDANAIAQHIEDMIVAAVEAHRENEPHLYPDGSRA